MVEMLYLQAESGLTQALKDVRSDGSPLCILIEQTNVALSSCTVIIFSESLKSKSPPRSNSKVTGQNFHKEIHWFSGRHPYDQPICPGSDPALKKKVWG